MENKRVLVTGGSGFIPSHLVRRLKEEGADVCIITKYNSIFDNIRLSHIWNDVKVIEADIRNQDSLKQIKKFEPEVIFHSAAYNHVGHSFTHVAESLDVNAKGTANLLEAYDGYEKFVYFSTSEIYGLQDGVPFIEDMNPSPISPYSIGKYSGELYCRMKMGINNLPIVVLRPFNTFGPYQSAQAIIPEMIINCLAGKPIVTTKGEQTREFNYVSNIVDAFILAANKKSAVGKVMNVGSAEEIPIRDLVKKIHEFTNSKSELKIGELPYRPTEIWRMKCSNDKAKEILGWEPKINFETGLKKTIEWFKGYMDVYENKDSSLNKLNKNA